jgi:hypothetical protein
VTELLERIRGSEREPSYVEVSPEGYITNWYVPKHEIADRMRRSKVIGGMDLSEGIGRDAITLVLVDPHSLEVIATTAVNETNIIRFTGWVADLMEKYENIILIPERKSMGVTLIDTLLIRLPAVGIDPFKRIYNLIVDEHKERPAEYLYLQHDMARRPANFNDKNKKEFGFATAGTGRHSRESLYQATLQRAAALGGDKCYDSQLIDEICGLASKNGRIDHADKGHDDMVIGWLLAVWMLTTSKNLSHYGITHALSATREYRVGETNVVVNDNLVRFEEHRQKSARVEMERLLDELRNEKDDRIIRMTEMRIRALDSRLVEQYDDAQSIDALISNAAESRSRRVRENARARQTQLFRKVA